MSNWTPPNTDYLGPFEKRVLPVMFGVRLPNQVELCGYCHVSHMTPALVEALVEETERMIGEPVRHTIRKLFPKPLDRSIQDEVILGWKAPKRGLTLSNKYSSPNYLTIHAERHPCPKGGAYPADWAYFKIWINSDAPNALKVLTNVERYAELSHAFFVRADSPNRWEGYDRAKSGGADPRELMHAYRLVADEGWAIADGLGWINYFGSRASAELELDSKGAEKGAESWGKTAAGGTLVQVTKDPFDFADPVHWDRFETFQKYLSPHRFTEPVGPAPAKPMPQE